MGGARAGIEWEGERGEEGEGGVCGGCVVSVAAWFVD